MSETTSEGEGLYTSQINCETMVDVDLEFTDEEFIELAMEAHKQDITINKLVANILRNKIATYKE
jgi:hypothetical protein